MITPDELKTLRKQYMLTQCDVANLLHCTSRMYQRYEWGQTQMPQAIEELLRYKLKEFKNADGKVV